MPDTTTTADKSADKPARKPRTDKPASTLAAAATQAQARKRRPVFKDVPGIPRVPMADGRVGCVQAEVILEPDGSFASGPHMLTIPRRNADGSESGARFPLADVQLLADAFSAAGLKLV